MALFADQLKRVLQIQGQNLVLVPDLVGPVPISEQHQYVESVAATNTCPTIHIREADIEEMRERFPGVAVYGMWNVLINSGLVSLKRTLQIVPVEGDDGYYIHCDLGRAEYSGIYESGFFAADAGFSLEEAHELNPALEQLVIPAQPAKLAVELRMERRVRQRQAWSSMALTVVAIIVLAVSANLTLDRFYAIEQAEYQTMTRALQDVRTGVDQLRTTRLTEVPNDTATIDRIASVWALDPNFECKGDQSFQNESLQFTLGNLQDDPREKLPWLTSRYDPKGSWLVSMNTRG